MSLWIPIATGRSLREATYDIFLDMACSQSFDWISWSRMASCLRIPNRRTELGSHPLSNKDSNVKHGQMGYYTVPLWHDGTQLLQLIYKATKNWVQTWKQRVSSAQGGRRVFTGVLFGKISRRDPESGICWDAYIGCPALDWESVSWYINSGDPKAAKWSLEITSGVTTRYHRYMLKERLLLKTPFPLFIFLTKTTKSNFFDRRYPFYQAPISFPQV